MRPQEVPLLFSNRTDSGRLREVNEDYLGYFRSGRRHLFALADGMGGEVGGREASRAAVAAAQEIFEAAGLETDPAELLARAVRAANDGSLRLQRERPELAGMGTTLELVLIEDNLAWWSHIGDSRIYRVSDGRTEQLTSDHTVVNRLLKKGLISPEEAKDHPERHVLSRVLGREDNSEPDASSTPITLDDGDALVLCSDGLSDLVTDEEIGWIVGRFGPQKACERLVELANERGGTDNITVQVVFRGRARKAWRALTTAVRGGDQAGAGVNRVWVRLAAAVVILLLAVLILWTWWSWRQPRDDPDKASAAAPEAGREEEVSPHAEPSLREFLPEPAATDTQERFRLVSFTETGRVVGNEISVTKALEDGSEATFHLRTPDEIDDRGVAVFPFSAVTGLDRSPIFRLRWDPADGESGISVLMHLRLPQGRQAHLRAEIHGVLDSPERSAWTTEIRDGEVRQRATTEPRGTPCEVKASENLQTAGSTRLHLLLTLVPSGGALYLAPGGPLCRFPIDVSQKPAVVEARFVLEGNADADTEEASAVFSIGPVFYTRSTEAPDSSAIVLLHRERRQSAAGGDE